MGRGRERISPTETRLRAAADAFQKLTIVSRESFATRVRICCSVCIEISEEKLQAMDGYFYAREITRSTEFAQYNMTASTAVDLFRNMSASEIRLRENCYLRLQSKLLFDTGIRIFLIGFI